MTKLRYPNGANVCSCLFDDSDKQVVWCSVHEDMKKENDIMKKALKEILLYQEELSFEIVVKALKELDNL